MTRVGRATCCKLCFRVSQTRRETDSALLTKCLPRRYIAYNTSHAPQKISLPAIPGHKWFPKIDTGKAQPYDVLEKDELTAAEWEAAFAQLEPMLAYDSYFMLPYSSLVMVSQPEKETVESPAP